MSQSTLADKVKEHSEVKLKQVSVKVPSVKVGKEKTRKQNAKVKKSERPSPTSLVSLLIKAALERAKREKKAKPATDDKIYTIIKEQKPLIANGGYGAASRGYDTPPQTSYIDYGKLFSHLGKFKAQSPYDMTDHLVSANSALDDRGFFLVDKETMDKGARHVKYFMSPVNDVYTAALSFMPIAGMNSAEWEQFKLLMQLDKPMFKLKTTTI